MTLRRFSPMPAIEVWCRRDGTPERFRWRGRTRWIGPIEHTWDLGEGWWRDDPTDWRHYRVRASDGLVCTILRDNATGQWHLYAIDD